MRYGARRDTMEFYKETKKIKNIFDQVRYGVHGFLKKNGVLVGFAYQNGSKESNHGKIAVLPGHSLREDDEVEFNYIFTRAQMEQMDQMDQMDQINIFKNMFYARGASTSLFAESYVNKEVREGHLLIELSHERMALETFFYEKGVMSFKGKGCLDKTLEVVFSSDLAEQIEEDFGVCSKPQSVLTVKEIFKKVFLDSLQIARKERLETVNFTGSDERRQRIYLKMLTKKRIPFFVKDEDIYVSTGIEY